MSGLGGQPQLVVGQFVLQASFNIRVAGKFAGGEIVIVGSRARHQLAVKKIASGCPGVGKLHAIGSHATPPPGKFGAEIVFFGVKPFLNKGVVIVVVVGRVGFWTATLVSAIVEKSAVMIVE